MRTANINKVGIILIITWIFTGVAAKLDESISLTSNCEEYYASNPIKCKRCKYNYHLLSNNKCKLKQMNKYYAHLENILNKTVEIVYQFNNKRKTTETNKICKLEDKNCEICYNNTFCLQCKTIEYFIDEVGKCNLFCDNLNCQVCAFETKSNNETNSKNETKLKNVTNTTSYTCTICKPEYNKVAITGKN